MPEIEFSKKSLKFLKKTDKEVCSRILEKIESLKENPFPKKCKRVEGEKEKVFRIRVGKYRVLYIFNNEKIKVARIDKRDKVYDL